MKVIVSHDVDHLTFWEHRKDLIIPKFFARNTLECLKGTTTTGEWFKRLAPAIHNRWHRLPELMEFNRNQHIPATFFFGVQNGCNLNYSQELAKEWISQVAEKGFDVGVHGIGYRSYEEIKSEFDDFSRITGNNLFGIRMHYLRQTNETFAWMNQAGYLFDSTLRATDISYSPYRIGTMWEFPLHIMDGDIIEADKRYASKRLTEAMEMTKRRIDTYFGKEAEYFTVLFHDRYFDDSFRTWLEWYQWLIGYLKSSGFTFIGYPEAVEELNAKYPTGSRSF